MSKSTIIILVVVAAVAGAFWLTRPGAPQGAADAVIVPALSATQKQGETAFNAKCSACHGRNAAGSDKGPPLIHRIYMPNHHGDRAFFMAAQRGTRAHHWQFGDMKPVAGVTRDEVKLIIDYVRALQRANGIF